MVYHWLYLFGLCRKVKHGKWHSASRYLRVDEVGVCQLVSVMGTRHGDPMGNPPGRIDPVMTCRALQNSDNAIRSEAEKKLMEAVKGSPVWLRGAPDAGDRGCWSLSRLKSNLHLEEHRISWF
jgi:hypothetical protein